MIELNKFVGLVMAVSISVTLVGQDQTQGIVAPSFSITDSITRGDYTLIFINKDSTFSDITKNKDDRCLLYCLSKGSGTI